MKNNKEFYCVYCQGNFQELIPFGFKFSVLEEKKVVGAGYRPCMCPGCYSTDRERLILIFLKRKSDFFIRPIKLLHISPERNLRHILSTSANIEYFPGDKFPEMYGHSNNTLELDITNIPIGDNTFDVIICNHVLEHIVNDKLAISELYRVLKPDGWAILQVPISLVLKNTYEDASIISPEEREEAFGQFDHVRLYGRDYKQRLENVGFNVNIFNPTQERWINNIDKYGINAEEDIFVATKLT